MKRDNVLNYGHAVNVQDIINHNVDTIVPDDDLMEYRDSKDSFLKIVYAVDERTKLPKGDLQYLVSDKANPEVKNWILQNIMLDTSSAVTPSAPRGLSDDDIAALARSPKENLQQYAERVNKYMNANFQAYERMAKDYKESLAAKSEPNVPVEP